MLLVALLLVAARTVPGFHTDICLQGKDDLKFQIQDQPGVSLVYIHVKDAGGNVKEYAATKQRDGGDMKWVHTIKNSGVKPGDIVTYKSHILQNGLLTSSEWKTETATYPIKLSRSMRSVVLFRDDFTTFNKDHYNIIVTANRGGNAEFQVYTNQKENLYVKNGHLYLRPTLTADDPKFSEAFLYNGRMDVRALWGECDYSWNWGCDRSSGHGTGATDILPPIMSGRIRTLPALRYGRVNVRAKLPLGDWIWPAIWLLPKDNKYGSWPRSGEIDIMEARCNLWLDNHDGVNHGITEVASTLHWGPDVSHNAFYKTHRAKQKTTGGNWHDEFHTYSLEWTADHIVTLVDDEEILRVNTPGNSFWGYGGFGGNNIWASGGRNAPFDQPFQLILNVAVGGNYFSDGSRYSHPKPWRMNSDHAMRSFWEKRGEWLKTWHGEEVAMVVDYVEMIQY